MSWTFYNSSGEALIEDGAAIAATQAEMETATATSDAAFVTPGRTQYHPGVAKAWCEDDTASGTANASYGVSGVVSGVTGRQVISWSTDFTSVNYAAPAVSHASGALLIQVSTVLVGSMEIFMRNVSEALTDAGYSFAVFGDQ